MLKNRISQTLQGHTNNVVVGCLLSGLSLIFLCLFLLSGTSNKKLKLNFIIGFLTVSAVQVVHAESSKKNAGLNAVYEKYIKEGVARENVLAQQFDSALDTIRGQENLVEVLESLPVHKRIAYAHQYRVAGLLNPIEKATGVNVDSRGDAFDSLPVTVKKALPVFDEKTEKLLNIDWMNNHEFFFKSGIVFGDEGSGKTSYLAYIALNILKICPDVDLKIHTSHYDPDSPWFPSMPSDVEESFFISNPRACYNDILNVRAELQRRVLEKDRLSPPIIRICDEFQDLKDNLSKDQWEEYINALTQCKNQGRKYAYKVDGKDTGIRIWLGSHSIKNKTTGLDSGFFSNSNMIVLGDSIADPNTIFPVSFDIKKLTGELNASRAMLIDMGLMNPTNEEKDKARPAVVRIGRSLPSIKTIPRIDLAGIEYQIELVNNGEDDDNRGSGRVNDDVQSADNYSGDDYIAKLKSWYRVNRKCTTEDLKKQVLILTGKIITDEMAEKLRGLIGDE